MNDTPNICPYCNAPLLNGQQCVAPACSACKKCDICGQYFTIRGKCPNPTCPNNFMVHSVDPPPISVKDEQFERTTMDFTVPNVTCDVCGATYESSLRSCPECARGESEDMESRKTIIPDILPSDPCPPPDRSGVHAQGSGAFTEEPGSAIRSVSSAPTVVPPAEPPAPDVEYSITDADDEEAALIAAETQKLLKEESA